MLSRTVLVALSIVLASAGILAAQEHQPAKAASDQPSAAGTKRYANMPEEAVPFRKFSKPYKEWFVEEKTLDYNGAARDRIVEEIENSKTVNVGFLGPLENNPEAPYGRAMLQGAQMAIDAANARGGYGAGVMTRAKPYQLMVHNDSAQWGASSVETVKMAFDDNVVAILGSIDGASTHIMLRECLKLEIPIMDTGTTDPTVTETRIPWLAHNFPDDRQQGYALAGYIFKERKLKRIGVMRTQSRYARVGVSKFFDEAKRLGHVPVLEVKFERGDEDFATQLRMLQNAHIDGLVIWGEPAEAAKVLRQMRQLGMKQPVFGASRLADARLIQNAGDAAEGMVVTAALDLASSEARWQEFARSYREKFNAEPDAYAAYAYDGMTLLLHAVEHTELIRGSVMDQLRLLRAHSYEGVAGKQQFDQTLNNIAPLSLARVENGKFVYWKPEQN